MKDWRNLQKIARPVLALHSILVLLTCTYLFIRMFRKLRAHNSVAPTTFLSTSLANSKPQKAEVRLMLGQMMPFVAMWLLVVYMVIAAIEQIPGVCVAV